MKRKKDLHVTTRKRATSGKFQANLEPADTQGLDTLIAKIHSLLAMFTSALYVCHLV